MTYHLFNLSHDFSAPSAQDKPIFLPFGTWAYDAQISQTFTREAAAKIANELAAEIAAGNPGIPVYQGHPDVPNLAAKYPDKGALGWVKKIDLSNEGCSLTVEWDRFPGKGFGWFSPYWFGEKVGLDNQGKTLVSVDHIASIGLVNNPNISEFRLPNEAVEESARQKLIGELANTFKKTKLANVTDANGLSHGEDGKFDGGNGSGNSGGGSFEDRLAKLAAAPVSDPKTERMKARLAKMQAKNAAMKDDLEKRKARLASLRSELTKGFIALHTGK